VAVCRRHRLFVSRIGMAHDAGSGIGGQDPFQFLRRETGSICHDDLSGVD
jgi:hypothetical protein